MKLPIFLLPIFLSGFNFQGRWLLAPPYHHLKKHITKLKPLQNPWSSDTAFATEHGSLCYVTAIIMSLEMKLNDLTETGIICFLDMYVQY